MFHSSPSSFRLSVVAFGCICASCSLTPEADYPPIVDQISTLAAFQSELPKSAEISPSEGWWIYIGGAELDALVRTLIENNFSLTEAREDITQSIERYHINRGQRLPAVNLSTGNARTNFLQPSGEFDWIDSFDLDLTATLESDVFGRLRSAERSSYLSIEATKLTYRAREQQEIARLASNWIAASTLQRRLDLARDTAASFQSTYELTDQRYRGGSTGVSANDVQIARQNYESSLIDIPDLEAQYKTQLFEIDTQVASLPGQTQKSFLGSIDLKTLSAPNLDVPSAILSSRPDIAAADFRYRAALEDIGSAKASLYPALNLSASLSFSGESASDALDWDARIARLSQNLTQPLFQGGRLKAQVRLEQSEARELATVFARTALEALTDIEAALTDLRSLSEQRRRQAEAVETARTSNTLAQSRYRQGSTSILSVLETQRSLNNAALNLILIEQAFLNAHVELALSQGGHWFPAPKETGGAHDGSS
ncbi:MAG: efflux transporter outer membrane subunit [Pseudomonadota bacterium]